MPITDMFPRFENREKDGLTLGRTQTDRAASLHLVLSSRGPQRLPEQNHGYNPDCKISSWIMALFFSPKRYVLFQWAKLLFHTSESMLGFLRSLCRHCSRGFCFHKVQAFSKVHAGVCIDFKRVWGPPWPWLPPTNRLHSDFSECRVCSFI